MNKKLMDAHEQSMQASVASLFAALRNETISRDEKIREVLDFHFGMQEQIKDFLEDLGAIEY